jgi:hypothetical protein
MACTILIYILIEPISWDKVTRFTPINNTDRITWLQANDDTVFVVEIPLPLAMLSGR